MIMTIKGRKKLRKNKIIVSTVSVITIVLLITLWRFEDIINYFNVSDTCTVIYGLCLLVAIVICILFFHINYDVIERMLED